MTTGTMFADLLAAQREMPALQKTAINPHFKNSFVPLDTLLQAVVPILNKHNLVLLQLPAIVDGQAALTYRLQHSGGESIEGTMLLASAKDDPQGQGSAITYARRYSLMSLLGLSADTDDDGQATRRNGSSGYQAPSARPAPELRQQAVMAQARVDSACPECRAPAGKHHATGCALNE